MYVLKYMYWMDIATFVLQLEYCKIIYCQQDFM